MGAAFRAYCGIVGSDGASGGGEGSKGICGMRTEGERQTYVTQASHALRPGCRDIGRDSYFPYLDIDKSWKALVVCDLRRGEF